MRILATLALVLGLTALWGVGSRVVGYSLNYTPSQAHLRALAVQAKAPYDDVEGINACMQCVWLMQVRGEAVTFECPKFVPTW